MVNEGYTMGHSLVNGVGWLRAPRRSTLLKRGLWVGPSTPVAEEPVEEWMAQEQTYE